MVFLPFFPYTRSIQLHLLPVHVSCVCTRHPNTATPPPPFLCVPSPCPPPPTRPLQASPCGDLPPPGTRPPFLPQSRAPLTPPSQGSRPLPPADLPNHGSQRACAARRGHHFHRRRAIHHHPLRHRQPRKPKLRGYGDQCAFAAERGAPLARKQPPPNDPPHDAVRRPPSRWGA